MPARHGPPRTTDTRKHTGLVCSVCERPVAFIENKLRHMLIFHCPACGHWWSADEPGAPKQ
jgi:hypothetical protein